MEVVQESSPSKRQDGLRRHAQFSQALHVCLLGRGQDIEVRRDGHGDHLPPLQDSRAIRGRRPTDRGWKQVTLSDSEIIEELDSWRRFADALRGDDKELFVEMLRLCHEYFPAMQARDSPFPTEALFMSLLLEQHKTIVWLAKEVERTKAEKHARMDS